MSTAVPGTLLVIVYYFPPWGGGPVLRTLKFVKYLARLGWRIRVLTADPSYYEPFSNDPTLLAEIDPMTVIYRARSLRPTGRLADELLAQASRNSITPRLGWMRFLMPFARALHSLLIPDDKILWFPHALLAGKRLLDNARADVVLVSAPPHSTTLLGYALSRFAGCPLVLDFRDDWLANPLYASKAPIRRYIERRMASAIIDGAAAIIVPTEESRSRLRAHFPKWAERIHTIPNGFDHDDISAARRSAAPLRRETRALRCIYAGLINERRDIDPLVTAVRRIDSRIPGAIHVTFAGFVPETSRRTIEALGLANCVALAGYLPHAAALRCMSQSDVGILLSTTTEGAATAVPSKLYEYVACGTYVLGLVDEGATADLIRKNGWGTTCSPRSAEAIERALLELHERKSHGEPLVVGDTAPSVEQYSRRAQAEALANILSDVSRPAQPLPGQR